MLRHRCGRCWLRRWRRTGSWRGWRRSCARRTRGCGRRTRGRRLSWSECALTWRFCSGWCSGGRRSGRGPEPPGGDGDAAGRAGCRERHGEETRPGGAGGAAGLLASAPVRGVLGFPGRRVLLPGVRGAVHAAGGSLVRGAAGLAGDRAAGGALPAPVQAGLRVPGAGDGDGAGPAEGGREGPVHERVHRDAADGAVHGGPEHELAGEGPGPAGRGDLARRRWPGPARRPGRCWPRWRRRSRSGRGARGTCTRTRRRGGSSRRGTGTARRSGGCGCSSARTPRAS